MPRFPKRKPTVRERSAIRVFERVHNREIPAAVDLEDRSAAKSTCQIRHRIPAECARKIPSIRGRAVEAALPVKQQTPIRRVSICAAGEGVENGLVPARVEFVYNAAGSRRPIPGAGGIRTPAGNRSAV